MRRLRNQNWLFHPTIADLIEEDHICRLVDDVVESIDFKSIEWRYDGPGSPAYHPKVMMKLIIQGTIDGIRSSRKIYRVRAKTVERLFGHVKQNIGLRAFLTRALRGVRAEFSLACIAHNLKRIGTIKNQTKAIGVNSTKNGRIDRSSLKNLCSSIKGVWSQILSSFSKVLSIYQV
ncbi:MAG: transposase [Halobacteriota archaeon]